MRDLLRGARPKANPAVLPLLACRLRWTLAGAQLTVPDLALVLTGWIAETSCWCGNQCIAEINHLPLGQKQDIINGLAWGFSK